MNSPEDILHDRRKRPLFSPDRSNEKEKRLNANMIERRRMQNINLGFTSLKKLLPPTEKKQTKAAILQQAVQHILRLQGTVVQVRENNNLLRQTLADERKQRFVQGKQLEALLAEKFVKRDVHGRNAYHSPAQFKPRPLTPPHDDNSDRAYDRWPSVPCDHANTSEYQLVDMSVGREMKKRVHDSSVRRKYYLWEGNRASEGSSNQKVIPSRRRQESGPSIQEASGSSGSGDTDRFPHSKMRGNNLHCIVDAINLIEKS